MIESDCKNVLSVYGLRIERGDTVILNDISWEIKQGQHWVILGANGSGKTSLLSAMTGYFPPTDGQITILDHQYGDYDWRELRKEVGIVGSSLCHLMADEERAIESIVSGKSASLDYREELTPLEHRAAMKILRRVECAHLAWREWRFLSQGERQRILIGRALMAKPKILILDEPCAGLDPAAREQFLQFIQHLSRKKNHPTIIFVTHHVEEITPCFTHVLLLKQGRVLAAGTKDQMLKSSHLSKTFSTPVAIRSRNGRCRLAVKATKNKIV